MKQEMKSQAVAIMGMGVICSLGEGTDALRLYLTEGKSNFIRLNYSLLTFPVVSATITDFVFNKALERFTSLNNPTLEQIDKASRRSRLDVAMAVICALEAWQQASLNDATINPEHVGIVVAAQNSTTNYQYNLYPKFIKNPNYLSPNYALQFMDSDTIGVLSEIFSIQGEGFTVGGASATGNIAILRAFELINHRSVDACLVIGSLANLSPMELQGFHNIGALGGKTFADEPNKACRPFDKQHDGFIYGQAACCLILESLSSALRRQVPILAYLLGGACLLDGNHLTNPNLDGEIRVMKKAVKNAGIAVSDIDYINTHGTSAPLGDEIEIAAIESFLGAHRSQVLLNSTKSIVGHCLWSAGIIEAIATVLQLQTGFVHPTLNLVNPINNRCHIVRGRCEHASPTIGLSNSFGFSGINTSIVIAKNQ